MFIEMGQGGNGGQTETTLWTNNAPTSAFTSQEISLSQAYTNFKRIRFEFRGSTTDSTEDAVEYLKEDVDDWVIAGVNPTAYKQIGGITFLYGGTSYVRLIRKGTNNNASAFYITTAYKGNQSGNSTSYGIPTKIVGIN